MPKAILCNKWCWKKWMSICKEKNKSVSIPQTLYKNEPSSSPGRCQHRSAHATPPSEPRGSGPLTGQRFESRRPSPRIRLYLNLSDSSQPSSLSLTIAIGVRSTSVDNGITNSLPRLSLSRTGVRRGCRPTGSEQEARAPCCSESRPPGCFLRIIFIAQ